MKLADLKLGDRLNWIMRDFDMVRPEKVSCSVIGTFEDYAIAESYDGMRLWIDNDTIEQFERRREYE